MVVCTMGCGLKAKGVNEFGRGEWNSLVRKNGKEQKQQWPRDNHIFNKQSLVFRRRCSQSLSLSIALSNTRPTLTVKETLCCHLLGPSVQLILSLLSSKPTLIAAFDGLPNLLMRIKLGSLAGLLTDGTKDHGHAGQHHQKEKPKWTIVGPPPKVGCISLATDPTPQHRVGVLVQNE